MRYATYDKAKMHKGAHTGTTKGERRIYWEDNHDRVEMKEGERKEKRKEERRKKEKKKDGKRI